MKSQQERKCSAVPLTSGVGQNRLLPTGESWRLPCTRLLPMTVPHLACRQPREEARAGHRGGCGAVSAHRHREVSGGLVTQGSQRQHGIMGFPALVLGGWFPNPTDLTARTFPLRLSLTFPFFKFLPIPLLLLPLNSLRSKTEPETIERPRWWPQKILTLGPVLHPHLTLPMRPPVLSHVSDHSPACLDGSLHSWDGQIPSCSPPAPS